MNCLNIIFELEVNFYYAIDVG